MPTVFTFPYDGAEGRYQILKPLLRVITDDAQSLWFDFQLTSDEAVVGTVWNIGVDGQGRFAFHDRGVPNQLMRIAEGYSVERVTLNLSGQSVRSDPSFMPVNIVRARDAAEAFVNRGYSGELEATRPDLKPVTLRYLFSDGQIEIVLKAPKDKQLSKAEGTCLKGVVGYLTKLGSTPLMKGRCIIT